MKDLFILFVVSVAASACAVAVTTGAIDGPMAAWTSPASRADAPTADRSSSGLDPCAGFSFLR